MLTVAYIAEHLEIEERTVRYYIENGYLKAELKEGKYCITSNDLSDFKQDYYYSARLSNKGKGKRLDEEQFNALLSFIEFVKDGCDSVEDLIKEYEKTELRIPSLTAYLRYKRNEEIRIDRSVNGMTNAQLSKKYGLCINSIENITGGIERNKATTKRPA